MLGFSTAPQSARLEIAILDFVIEIGHRFVDRTVPNFQFWFFEDDRRVGGDRSCDPDARPDHAVMADYGVTTKDRCVGVNHHMVFDGRVAFGASNQFTGSIGGKAQSAQRDSLIDLDVIADFAGFPDYDTRTVIDEEVIADFCTGVDIDAGLFVGPFAHHAWNEGNLESVQFVGDPVDGDCFEAWKAEHDFIAIGHAGIAGVGGVHVLCQGRPEFRNAFQHGDGQGVAFVFVIDGFLAVLHADAINAIGVEQGPSDLRGESIVEGIDQVADVVGHIACVQAFATAKAWVKDVLQILENLDHHFVLGERAVPQMVDSIRGMVRIDNCVGQSRQLFFETGVVGHSEVSRGKRLRAFVGPRFLPVEFDIGRSALTEISL